MKVLLITRERMTLSVNTVIDRLGELCDLTVIRFSGEQVKKIRKSLKEIDHSGYDCVVLNLPFRRWHNKPRLIKRFSKLAVYEFDTNRNFLKGDKFQNKYAKFCKKLNHIKLICSGFYNTSRFNQLGVDASFVSKGYNNKLLTNLNVTRDIELGFIGRIDDDLYIERKALLKEIQSEFDLKLLRTETETEYLNTLNKIKIFVSADIGYNEYMAKNFEAMGCGCMLLCKEQGHGEEEALGLVDMHNVALYSDAEDAKEKIRTLLQDSALVETIAKNGQKLAETTLSFEKKAEEIFQVLKDKYS